MVLRLVVFRQVVLRRVVGWSFVWWSGGLKTEETSRLVTIRPTDHQTIRPTWSDGPSSGSRVVFRLVVRWSDSPRIERPLDQGPKTIRPSDHQTIRPVSFQSPKGDSGVCNLDVVGNEGGLLSASFSPPKRVLHNSGYRAMMAILGVIFSGCICLFYQAQTLRPSNWAFCFPSVAFCV